MCCSKYRDELIVFEFDDFADDDRLPTRFDQLTIAKHPRLAVVHLVIAAVTPLFHGKRLTK